MDVYKITNIITGKHYVGFSKNVASRFKRHIFLAESGVNRRLYDSMRKHGVENFVLEIMENCDTRHDAARLEKFWILELNSMMPNGYNMTSGGDGGNTLLNWTDAQKKELYAKQVKAREGYSHNEKTRLKISNALRGKTMPIERRLKLSQTMKRLGIKPPITKGKMPWIAGKTHSTESRKKISEARIGKNWEDLWDAEYIKERKTKMREMFSGDNNPRFVKFSVKDKITVLKMVASSFDFRLKDSRKMTGFSEFKIRELFREVGVLNFQSFKKTNKDNWKDTIHNLISKICSEGTDVSDILNIQKHEAPIPACLAGDARGLFPSSVPKTDQERIQNLSGKLKELSTHIYEVTEKLHGSSCTLWLDNEADFHVCSRNLDLKETESNSYWKAARKYDVEQKMKDLGLKGFTIQGELIGEGINGNQYKTSLDFYVFDMYDTVFQRYLTSSERLAYCEKLGLKHVPALCNSFSIGMDGTVDSLLAYAEGKSELNGGEREGVVMKSLQDPSVSFKAVSNKWLIKTGE